MKLFETDKKENLKSKLKRSMLNAVPAFICTGAYISFLSDDWLEVHVGLTLNIRTFNYVKTVFGGSIYSSADPIFMVQLINILGKNYIVWDKSGNVKFIRPIKKKVRARFLITPEILEDIKKNVAEKGEYNINLETSYTDSENNLYAIINKTIYIADKEFYLKKKINKEYIKNTQLNK